MVKVKQSFKKITAYVVLALMILFTLAGCNLFQRDDYLFYTEVVATVNGENIYKEELMRVVGTNAGTYMQQYGMTAKEAVTACLDSLINQRVLIQKGQEREQAAIDAGEEYFTNKEINDVWISVIDTIASNLMEFETEVLEREKQDKDDTSGTDTTQKEDTSSYVWTAFEQQAKVVYADFHPYEEQYRQAFKAKFIAYYEEIFTAEERQKFIDETVKKLVKEGKTFEAATAEANVKADSYAQDKAEERIVRWVKDNTKYRIIYSDEKLVWNAEKWVYNIEEIYQDGRSDDEALMIADEKDFAAIWEKGIKKYEENSTYRNDSKDKVDRIHKEAEKEYLKQLKTNEEWKKIAAEELTDEKRLEREIERIKKIFMESLHMRKVLDSYRGDFFVEEEGILEIYKRKVQSAYVQYQIDKKGYVETISEGKDVFYVPPTDKTTDTRFYVGHILIQYSSAQLAQIAETKEKFDAGMTNLQWKTFEEYMEYMKTQLRATERDLTTGAVVSTNKTVQQVMGELNNAMAGTNGEQERADVFRQFMYRYSEDPGLRNADYLYTVGTINSGMMESFTDAARKLRGNGSAKNIYTNTFDQLAYAERDDGSGGIDYGGYHFLFYAGDVANVVEFQNYSNINTTNDMLYIFSQTRVNQLSNKTLFDLLFSEYSDTRSFSVFENLYVSNLKENAVVKRYVSAYKDLWK